MTTKKLPPWEKVSLTLGVATFAYPVASYVLQQLVFMATGWHLRAGDAAIHLIWSGVFGIVGLVLVLMSASNARKILSRGSALRVIVTGVSLSLVLAAMELYSHDPSRFCGGSIGECGSWN
jgi:hypothetical protein